MFTMTHSPLRRTTALATLCLSACGGGSPSAPDGGGTDASLSGVVQSSETSAALQGATITVGNRVATSDGNGRFELTGLSLGTVTIQCSNPEYAASESITTLREGSNTQDFSLSVQEVYEFGSSGAFIPKGSTTLLGAIIALGGPIASGFTTGKQTAPELPPDVEAANQTLGAGLRALASSRHLALLGSSISGMPDGGSSDAALLQALAEAGRLSGVPELNQAPVLVLGISGRGPEASGFASRNPGRTISAFLRKPSNVQTLSGPALAVPAYLLLGELDNVVNNGASTATFSSNRSQGALWTMAVEPGEGHYGGTAADIAATTAWMAVAVDQRLPASPGGSLVTIDETSGWLGNLTTFAIATGTATRAIEPRRAGSSTRASPLRGGRLSEREVLEGCARNRGLR